MKNRATEGVYKPLFIFGPPRSGTTYLAAVLNQHPQAFITNELRVLDFVNSVMREKATDLHLIHNGEFRDAFIAKLEPAFANLIAEFYTERLNQKGASSGIWGDKTPGYGDPHLSPGCLERILSLFPDALFLMITRNGLDTVNSIVAKGWETADGAVDQWYRIITNGRRFASTLPSSQFLEIAHEELCDAPERVLESLFPFLGLVPDESVLRFVEEQRTNPIPISNPVYGKPMRGTEPPMLLLSPSDEERVSLLLGQEPRDLEKALLVYAAQRRSTTTSSPFSIASTSAQSATAGAYRVSPVDCSGALEAIITDFALSSAGKPLESNAGEIAATLAQQIEIEIGIDATRKVEELIAGYVLFDEHGQGSASETNCSAGLPPIAIDQGKSRLTMKFPIPKVAPGSYALTLVLGEGNDHANHRRQCWANRVAALRISA